MVIGLGMTPYLDLTTIVVPTSTASMVTGIPSHSLAMRVVCGVVSVKENVRDEPRQA